MMRMRHATPLSPPIRQMSPFSFRFAAADIHARFTYAATLCFSLPPLRHYARFRFAISIFSCLFLPMFMPCA